MIEKLNSFSEAANELFISQSTLSKQIKALEKDLGFKLFDRTTRKIKMTRAGEIFSRHAHRIVTEYHAMLQETQAYQADFSVINIAAIPVLEAYDIHLVFEEFQQQHPNILVEVDEVDRPYALSQLRKGTVNMAILRSSFMSADEFYAIPIIQEELVLVISSSHQLAEREEVSLKEVAKETFFFLSKHTGVYTLCVEECAKAGFFPTVRRSELSRSSIKSKIRRKEGITLMANGIANEIYDPSIRILKLKEHPRLDLSFILRNEQIDEQSQLLIDYVTDHFTSFKM